MERSSNNALEMIAAAADPLRVGFFLVPFMRDSSERPAAGFPGLVVLSDDFYLSQKYSIKQRLGWLATDLFATAHFFCQKPSSRIGAVAPPRPDPLLLSTFPILGLLRHRVARILA
jgi:hypothetical protein